MEFKDFNIMANPNDRQYTNGEITVYWKPAKCIHATTCFRELLDVFNPRKRPWINMQGASTEEIISVTDKCPTAAIYWKYNKDLKESPEISADYSDEVNPESLHSTKLQNEATTRISIMKDGPILVDGDFLVTDYSGKDLKPTLMTSFCRCGHSQSQPFCDGTHRKVGFIDE